MTISDIKDRLTIETVLRHYGIEVDKNGMAKCPFHDDKKPSFKVYRDTNTWCCFSGNCDAETGDVIEFIGLKEGFISRLSGAVVGCKEGKYRAILKAKELLGSGNGLLEGNQAVAGSLANPVPLLTLRVLYPSPKTKKLILTESIIDAATLLTITEVAEKYTVLALFGTMGLTTEHRNAINQLTQLEEIIFWMDGDEAGEQSVERYAKQLRENYDTNQQSSNPAW